MSRGQNTIKRSEVSTTPILLKYSASYDSSSFIANGITVNRGVNTSFNTNGVTYLNYALVKQLYYQEYITGSALGSSSFWDPSIQSTAALGTFDNDYRYFPTSSSAQVTVIGIPRTAFGEQISRKSLCITGSTYKLIDDGNGNVIDANSSYTHVGNILYSQGVIIITDEEYQNAMIPIPGTTTTTTSTTSTTTTATPTTTTSTTSTTTTVAPTTTTSTTTTTTLAPTTTTSTTSTTTTVSPTTSTTTTTTIAPTTSTTTTTTIAPTTTTSTTTSTTTDGTTLFVYARYINTNGDLQYSINSGGTVNIGALPTGCSFMTQITGLSSGDIVDFSDANTKFIAGAVGFNAGCPTTGYLCDYSVTIAGGPNYVYITIKGDQNC
jgi:hypothetical protein